MSESSYRVTAFSRRQPTNRRQRSPKAQKMRQPQSRNMVQRVSTHQQYQMPKGATLVKLSSPPLTATPPIKRAKSKAPVRGKIPPYNPNAVKPKTVRVRYHSLPKKSVSTRKTRLKPMARTILYALRLLIVGVGIGAIVGTVLSVFDPATRITTTGGTSPRATVESSRLPSVSNSSTVSPLVLTQEITPLKARIQSLIAAHPNLTPGVFLVDLENGGFVDMNGLGSISAASTIKIPILVAFFQDVDAGKIRLDETLTLQKEMVAGGSGNMQYKPVGSQFTALEVATKMMTISDNTATNMLIARLGGIEALNQRFQSWGLTTTAIRNFLPDLEGTNTTSPKELAHLMAMVSKGNLVSMPSRDRLLDIMRRNERSHLLPTGLGQGAIIAHKTGDIGTVIADAGVVDMPTGKRYIIAVMVQRPNNDPQAEKLIGSISRVAYEHLTQITPVPTTNTSGSVPNVSYQSPPTFPQPLPNMGGTVPMGSYQAPVMSQPLPTGISNPIPMRSYQPPVVNPQYYYPYQR